MPAKKYTERNYARIGIEDLDEGKEYAIGPIEPDPALRGVRLAILMGPCPEEPEIVVPLDFLAASGAEVDIIAPDWTRESWLPAARFWTPTIKIPYQHKISHASVADYRGLILIGGTWNPAVLRTDAKMVAFVREFAKRGLVIFTICHGAQILISAGLVTKGLRVTGSPDIRVDLRNADAEVVENQAVVIDETSIYVGVSEGVPDTMFKIVSSRCPEDLAPFCRAIGAAFHTTG